MAQEGRKRERWFTEAGGGEDHSGVKYNSTVVFQSSLSCSVLTTAMTEPEKMTVITWFPVNRALALEREISRAMFNFININFWKILISNFTSKFRVLYMLIIILKNHIIFKINFCLSDEMIKSDYSEVYWVILPHKGFHRRLD